MSTDRSNQHKIINVYGSASRGEGKVILIARLEGMAEFEIPLWVYDRELLISFEEEWVDNETE